jgi:small subunit ribosomal protein S6
MATATATRSTKKVIPALVAATQKSEARRYEVMVILDANLEERAVTPALEGFLKVIRDSKGQVEKVDVWGRRRMSYEIDKRHEGIYSVLDLTATPAAVAELDRQLNLSESVLRTKVLRPDAR